MRGVQVMPDESVSSLVDETFDAVVIPGGAPGTANLGKVI